MTKIIKNNNNNLLDAKRAEGKYQPRAKPVSENEGMRTEKKRSSSAEPDEEIYSYSTQNERHLSHLRESCVMALLVMRGKQRNPVLNSIRPEEGGKINNLR